jgi:hypothetical protein
MLGSRPLPPVFILDTPLIVPIEEVLFYVVIQAKTLVRTTRATYSQIEYWYYATVFLHV